MMGARKLFLAAAASAAAMIVVPAAAQQSMTMVSFGGSYQDALRKALFEPAAKNLGITIREDQLKGIADVRLQVSSGKPTWDLVELARQYCIADEATQLFEVLDFTQIPNAGGHGANMKGERWVGGPIYYAYVMAWNTKKYGANPPKTWADFFDTQKFPGTRAMYNQARFMLEIALMADGVARDKMYPLDVERAFKKAGDFRKNVTVFFSTNGQSVQLMKDNEIDIIAMTDGRAEGARKDGASIDYTYEQGILDSGCLAIPKGSANKALAMKVINEFNNPDIQKNVPANFFPYGPVNPAAYEAGRIPADVAAKLNSAPANASKQLLLDSGWWAKNESTVQPRWDALVQR